MARPHSRGAGFVLLRYGDFRILLRSPQLFESLAVARRKVKTLQHVVCNAVGILETSVSHIMREVLRDGVV